MRRLLRLCILAIVSIAMAVIIAFAYCVIFDTAPASNHVSRFADINNEPPLTQFSTEDSRILSKHPSVEDIVKYVSPAVVTITVYDDLGDELGYGSGFFIGSGKILTNAHVIEDAYSAEVCSLRKTYEYVTIDKRDDDVDLAVLSVQSAGEPIISLANNTNLGVGQRIIVIGNPLGYERTVSDGLISSIKDAAGFQEIQITAPISGGSSGGPVLNTDGFVIGIAYAGVDEGQNLNFAVGIKTLKWFLKTSDHPERLEIARSYIPGRVVRYWVKNIVIGIVALAIGVISFIYILKRLCRLIKTSFRRNVRNKQQTVQLINRPPFADCDRSQRTIKMGDTAKQKKRRYLKAELTVLICLICIIVIAMITDGTEPVSAEDYRSLGEYYADSHIYHQAIQNFKEAIRINPDDAVAYFGLGDVYSDLYCYEKAIGAYREAIKIGHSDDYAKLGDNYLSLSRYNEAIEAYKESIRINPDDADVHLALGDAYCSAYGSDTNCPEEAIESYKEAIRLNPNSFDAHWFLGHFYYESSRYTDAIEHLKEAARIEPHVLHYDRLCLISSLHSLIGDAYYKLGRYDEAIKTYKRAIDWNSDNAEAHYNLAKAYLKIGNTDSALQEYEILKTLDEEMAKELFDLLHQ